MTTATATRPVSPITAAANAFVAAHLTEATALGGRLSELVADPDALVAAAEAGFADIADPAVREGIRRQRESSY